MAFARLARHGDPFAAIASLFILSSAIISLLAVQARAFPGDKNNDPRYTFKYQKDVHGRQSLTITGDPDEHRVSRWTHDAGATELACSNLATSRSQMVNLMAKQKAQRIFGKYGRSELADNVWPGTQYVHEVTVDSPATACAYHDLVRKHVNNLHHGQFVVWAFGIQERSRGHYEASCIVGSLEDAPEHVKAKELLKPLSARIEGTDGLEVSQDNERIRNKRAKSKQSRASGSQSEESMEKRSIGATKREETCEIGDVRSDSQRNIEKRGCVQSRGGTNSPPQAQQEEEEQRTESQQESELEQEPQRQTAQPSHPFRTLKPFSAFSSKAQADAKEIYHDQQQGQIFQKLLKGKKKFKVHLHIMNEEAGDALRSLVLLDYANVWSGKLRNTLWTLVQAQGTLWESSVHFAAISDGASSSSAAPQKRGHETPACHSSTDRFHLERRGCVSSKEATDSPPPSATPGRGAGYSPFHRAGSVPTAMLQPGSPTRQARAEAQQLFISEVGDVFRRDAHKRKSFTHRTPISGEPAKIAYENKLKTYLRGKYNDNFRLVESSLYGTARGGHEYDCKVVWLGPIKKAKDEASGSESAQQRLDPITIEVLELEKIVRSSKEEALQRFNSCPLDAGFKKQLEDATESFEFRETFGSKYAAEFFGEFYQKFVDDNYPHKFKVIHADFGVPRHTGSSFACLVSRIGYDEEASGSEPVYPHLTRGKQPLETSWGQGGEEGYTYEKRSSVPDLTRIETDKEPVQSNAHTKKLKEGYPAQKDLQKVVGRNWTKRGCNNSKHTSRKSARKSSALLSMEVQAPSSDEDVSSAVFEQIDENGLTPRQEAERTFNDGNAGRMFRDKVEERKAFVHGISTYTVQAAQEYLEIINAYLAILQDTNLYVNRCRVAFSVDCPERIRATYSVVIDDGSARTSEPPRCVLEDADELGHVLSSSEESSEIQEIRPMRSLNRNTWLKRGSTSSDTGDADQGAGSSEVHMLPPEDSAKVEAQRIFNGSKFRQLMSEEEDFDFMVDFDDRNTADRFEEILRKYVNEYEVKDAAKAERFVVAAYNTRARPGRPGRFIGMCKIRLPDPSTGAIASALRQHSVTAEGPTSSHNEVFDKRNGALVSKQSAVDGKKGLQEHIIDCSVPCSIQSSRLASSSIRKGEHHLVKRGACCSTPATREPHEFGSSMAHRGLPLPEFPWTDDIYFLNAMAAPTGSTDIQFMPPDKFYHAGSQASEEDARTSEDYEDLERRLIHRIMVSSAPVHFTLIIKNDRRRQEFRAAVETYAENNYLPRTLREENDFLVISLANPPRAEVYTEEGGPRQSDAGTEARPSDVVQSARPSDAGPSARPSDASRYPGLSDYSYGGGPGRYGYGSTSDDVNWRQYHRRSLPQDEQHELSQSSLGRGDFGCQNTLIKRGKSCSKPPETESPRTRHRRISEQIEKAIEAPAGDGFKKWVSSKGKSLATSGEIHTIERDFKDAKTMSSFHKQLIAWVLQNGLRFSVLEFAFLGGNKGFHYKTTFGSEVKLKAKDPKVVFLDPYKQSKDEEEESNSTAERIIEAVESPARQRRRPLRIREGDTSLSSNEFELSGQQHHSYKGKGKEIVQYSMVERRSTLA